LLWNTLCDSACAIARRRSPSTCDKQGDTNVQWQVEIDEARVSIDLMAFTKREFHATKVRARGIGFRARQKLEPSVATAERVAGLPPIVGFEGPPLRKAGPPRLRFQMKNIACSRPESKTFTVAAGRSRSMTSISRVICA
jgi:hypothetical protein